MTLSRTPKLAVAAAVSVLAVAPAALAATGHQTPSHRAKHAARNALMTAPWTPMVDESRLDPPFTGQSLADYAATLAWLQNRP